MPTAPAHTADCENFPVYLTAIRPDFHNHRHPLLKQNEIRPKTRKTVKKKVLDASLKREPNGTKNQNMGIDVKIKK